MTHQDILLYFQKLSSSSIQRVSILESSYDNIVLRDGSLVVRVSLNKSIEDVRRESEFLTFLHKSGVKVPRVVEVKEITPLPTSESFPCLITSYVAHVSHQNLTDNIIRQAALQLYSIHQQGYVFLRTKRYHQDRALDELLRRFMDRLISGMSPNASNREQVIADTQWALSILQRADKVDDPETIIHNDYRRQNLLSDGSNLVAVIDFDYSIASRSPQKDVAHAALEWSFPDGEDAPNMRIFKLFVSEYAKYLNKSYDEYTRETRLLEWVRAAAMIDAAGFYLHNPESTIDRFGSYMYKKYKYFQNVTELV